MLTPRGKCPQPEKFSPEEDRTLDAASSRTASPTHYQRAIPAPLGCFKSHHHALCTSGTGLLTQLYVLSHKEVADQTGYLTLSQYADTGPTSLGTDPSDQVPGMVAIRESDLK